MNQEGVKSAFQCTAQGSPPPYNGSGFRHETGGLVLVVNDRVMIETNSFGGHGHIISGSACCYSAARQSIWHSRMPAKAHLFTEAGFPLGATKDITP